MHAEGGLSSSSSSTSSSSPTSLSEAAPAAVEEMEAAEVLAELAHLAFREIGGGSGGGDGCGGGGAVACGGGGNWGCKGKRAKKRVKSLSPPIDPFVDPVIETGPDPPPDGEHVMISDQQCCEDVCVNVVNGPVKAEPTLDLSSTTNDRVRIYPSSGGGGGGRSRLNLTEAEKEERRLRRVLANRESARQTIRRRRALCEELTRKAADLAWENENLKREKELALKEYQSLEITNKQLKAQMTKLMKSEVEEAKAGNQNCSRLQMPPGTPVDGLHLYTPHPFSPVCWPRPSIQSQEQQEHPASSNVPRTPIYVVSCPWYFSVSDQGNGFHPQHSFVAKNIQDEVLAEDQCNKLSSKVDVISENGPSSLPFKIKPEPTKSEVIREIDDLNEAPVGFSMEEGNCFEEKQQSSVTNGIAVKMETEFGSERKPLTDNIYRKAVDPTRTVQQKLHDPFNSYLTKKSMDAAAAAEARRRRKELTKLKNLHTRQCRMNC